MIFSGNSSRDQVMDQMEKSMEMRCKLGLYRVMPRNIDKQTQLAATKCPIASHNHHQRYDQCFVIDLSKNRSTSKVHV